MKMLASIEGDNDEALRDLVRAHGVHDVTRVAGKDRRVEAVIDERQVEALTALGYRVQVLHDEQAAEARRADIAWHPDDDPRHDHQPHRGWPWPRRTDVDIRRIPRRPE